MEFVKALIQTILFLLLPSSDYRVYGGNIEPYYSDYMEFSSVCTNHIIKICVLLVFVAVLIILLVFGSKIRIDMKKQDTVSPKLRTLRNTLVVIEALLVFVISFVSITDTRYRDSLKSNMFEYYRADLTLISTDTIPPEIDMEMVDNGVIVADHISGDGLIDSCLITENGQKVDMPLMPFDCFEEEELLENDIQVIKNSYVVANNNMNRRGVVFSSFLALCFVLVAYCINKSLSTGLSMIIYSISFLLQIVLLVISLYT